MVLSRPLRPQHVSSCFEKTNTTILRDTGANLQWAYLRDVNFRDTMCFSAATRQHSSNEKFPSEECGHLTAISIESVTNGDEQVCMQAVIINLRIMCDLLHNNVCIQVGHWSRTQLMLEPTQSLILKPL